MFLKTWNRIKNRVENIRQLCVLRKYSLISIYKYVHVCVCMYCVTVSNVFSTVGRSQKRENLVREAPCCQLGYSEQDAGASKENVKVTSVVSLCDPTDCSPPGSSVHGKDTGVHSLLQGILPTQGSNPGLLHCRQILYCLSHQESLLVRNTTQFTLLGLYHYPRKLRNIQNMQRG